MVGMPYHLEKGPWLSVFEDYLNSDQKRTFDYLQALRASRATKDLSDMDESLIHQQGLNNTVDPFSKDMLARKRHLNEHWYGICRGSDGERRSDFEVGFVASTMEMLPEAVQMSLQDAGQVPKPDADRMSIEQFAADVSDALEAYQYQPGDEIFHTWPSTGFWFQYFGDVQSIMRETLIRALEVSLGLSHSYDGTYIDEKPDRHIPIELFWKCPQRWFEGWVCWRADADSGAGQVTVMLATPGHGKPVLESPVAGDGYVQNPSSDWTPTDRPPVSPPISPGSFGQLAPKGMWVITHKDHAQLPATPDEGATISGQWMVPSFGPSYVGVGEIVTVSPSERDGGVRPQGRRADEDTTLKTGQTSADNQTSEQTQEVR